MEKMILFGERLRNLRQEKNLTQKAMAELLECTWRHYCRFEKGEVNVPCLTAIFLADYFDVSLDYLVGRSEIREKR